MGQKTGEIVKSKEKTDRKQKMLRILTYERKKKTLIIMI